jgi:predicted acetyltransferase
MSYQLRPLEAGDSDAAWKLGSVAFGYHKQPQPDGWSAVTAGRHTVGAFAPDGALVAKAVDREQGQWFGGRIVPASGVAGVAVAPEFRKHGLGRLVLTRLLADARERGAVISTLYPTTPFPYRALGWEQVGALTVTAFPATALATVRSPATVRPATAEDFPAIDALYRSVAQASTGMMERSGPMFTATPEEFIEAFDGVTVALSPANAVVGFASWERGPGYDHTGKLTVYDLIGATAEATGALLSFLGGWASVAPTIAIRLSEQDPARYLFSQVGSAIESRHPWMLRIVDAVGAIAARGWPSSLDGKVDLALEDAECPWNNGNFRLTLAKGSASLEPGGSGAVTFSRHGLGQWYAGVAPALLRRAGFLRGDTGSDEFLQTATAGPLPVLQDYF